MNLDLRKDIDPIVMEIARRVNEFEATTNDGPGESGDAIQQITLGYQFDQAAWVALVFDTRVDADAVYDGEWQGFIEENVLDVDVEHWCQAYETLVEEQSRISIIDASGAEQTIDAESKSTDEEDHETEERLTVALAEYFGGVLRTALITSRTNGVFKVLPLTESCVMRVDEHEGNYGWPDMENRGGETDEGRVVS